MFESEAKTIRQPTKVVLVTGASRGLGRAVVCEIARMGHQAIAVARSADQLSDLQQKLATEDRTCDFFVCDVTQPHLVRELFAHCRTRYGRLDVLVNNAGVFRHALLRDTSDEVWRSVLDTNLSGPFLCCRESLDLLAAARGLIINVGSIAAVHPAKGMAAYAAAKAGLKALSDVLRTEVREFGVRVCTLLAGAIATEIWQDSGLSRIPPRNCMIPVSDVARFICFLIGLPPTMVVEEVVLMPPSGLLDLI
ncbi:MAG: beta-ketoacyl-ACP reductase [Candidatus Sumerlaea sp.]|nr:MAG: beta-ketoacyl-ACP reductase [Candidatus Sumerlaea sp.]